MASTESKITQILIARVRREPGEWHIQFSTCFPLMAKMSHHLAVACRMQYKCSPPRRYRSPPATAGDAQKTSSSLPEPTTSNVGPALIIAADPDSSSRSTWPPVATGAGNQSTHLRHSLVVLLLPGLRVIARERALARDVVRPLGNKTAQQARSAIRKFRSNWENNLRSFSGKRSCLRTGVRISAAFRAPRRIAFT